MTKKTSFHLDKCDLINSDSHNRRLRKFDHIREDLTHLNQSFDYVDHSLQKELSNIKREVKAKTDRKLQKNAIPIKEGVIVIKEDSTLEEIKNFCAKCEERWGIIPLRIHTHFDEGHYNSKGEWIPNLHAHIVWRMYNREGRNCRISDVDCSEMQTIAAECLGMERGKPSPKKHIKALKYKIQEQERELQRLTEELNNLKRERVDIACEVEKLKKEAVLLSQEVTKDKKLQDKVLKYIDKLDESANNLLDRVSDLNNKKKVQQLETELAAANADKLNVMLKAQYDAEYEINKERQKANKRIEESGDYKEKYEAISQNIESNKPYADYWNNLSEIAKKTQERGFNFTIGQMMELAEGKPQTIDSMPTGEKMEEIGEPAGIRVKWGRMVRDFVLTMKKRGIESWMKFDSWKSSFKEAKERLKNRTEKTKEQTQSRSKGHTLQESFMPKKSRGL